MTRPATGSTWAGAGLGDIDPRLAERGPLQGVLIRDYRGAATDISPFADEFGTVNFHPLAEDGTIRDDLLAARMVNGEWRVNPNPNEGWVFVGAMAEDGGPERSPNIENDDLYVLQSIYPYDSAVTQKGKTVAFTLVDTLKPLIHALEYDRRINDPVTGELVLPEVGEVDYFVGATLDPAPVDRQILLWFAKDIDGLPLYRIEPVPRARLNNQEARRRSKTDPDQIPFEYMLLPDPYFLVPDKDGSRLVPGFDGVWIGGPAWEALAGDGS